jgi:hypothetical protein
MHAWIFFTGPVPAETARRLGTGLLREAMAIRGKVNLASYDRLFPSQDLLPAGGVGNLIALPLFRPARDRNATVFLNLESLEPHQDQWSYLSTLGRMTPREATQAADKAGRVPAGREVTRLAAPVSTKIRPEATGAVRTRLGAGIRVELADLQMRAADHSRTSARRVIARDHRQTLRYGMDGRLAGRAPATRSPTLFSSTRTLAKERKFREPTGELTEADLARHPPTASDSNCWQMARRARFMMPPAGCVPSGARTLWLVLWLPERGPSVLADLVGQGTLPFRLVTQGSARKVLRALCGEMAL